MSKAPRWLATGAVSAAMFASVIAAPARVGTPLSQGERATVRVGDPPGEEGGGGMETEENVMPQSCCQYGTPKSCDNYPCGQQSQQCPQGEKTLSECNSADCKLFDFDFQCLAPQTRAVKTRRCVSTGVTVQTGCNNGQYKCGVDTTPATESNETVQAASCRDSVNGGPESDICPFANDPIWQEWIDECLDLLDPECVAHIYSLPRQPSEPCTPGN